MLLSLFLWTPPAFAAEWTPFSFTKNDCGINDGFDPVSIEDCEASDLQNIVWNTGGAIIKRSGFALINAATASSGATVTGLSFFKTSAGTRYLFSTTIVGSTSQFNTMTYGAGTTGPSGTWTNSTGTSAPLFDSSKHAVIVQAQDRLLITDGVGSNPIYVWTGTGNVTTLGGGSPNAGCIEFHKNIAWVSCNTTNPSQVAFSNVGDVTTWTSTDTININTNDGQIVRALKSGLDCLGVFKDFSIWRICGTNRDDVTTEQMVKGIGTLSPNSIQIINNQFIFMTSHCQVAAWDGGVNIQIISDKIQGTLNSINFNRCDNAVSAALEDQTGNVNYYLSLSNGGSGTNNLILMYDTAHRAWTKFVGMNASAMMVYELGTFQHALGFGDYGGFMYRYPSGASDNGALINAYYQTKQFSFPQIPQDKVWRLLETYLTQTGNFTMTIGAASDFGSLTNTSVSLNGTGALWDTAVWDTDSWADLTTVISRIEVEKNRRFFQARFSDNSTNPAFTVKGFTIWIEPTGRI